MPKYKEKSKAFVIEKIVQRVPGKISEEVIRQQISDILFERDYNDVTEMLSEYRKGEIQKKLDKETDSEKQLELMMMQAEKRSQLLKKGTQKKSRRKVF